MIVCPECEGSGEIYWNPSRRVPPDPQLEQWAKCRTCGGYGAVGEEELEPVDDIFGAEVRGVSEASSARHSAPRPPDVLTVRWCPKCGEKGDVLDRPRCSDELEEWAECSIVRLGLGLSGSWYQRQPIRLGSLEKPGPG